MKTTEMNSREVTAAAAVEAKQERDPAREGRCPYNPWKPDSPKMTREEIRQIVLEVLG
jgi:hypothetical protein